MGLFSWFKRKNNKKESPKIKIGLALGSGGAKGFATLGVIKRLEEEGFEFDLYAGTSIGSIIGAFLANGYSSTDVNELLLRINARDIINGFPISMDMGGLQELINENMGDLGFDELKKPFKAVATDHETGEAKVFGDGDLALALCASASIPPFFRPVTIDGRLYVDGAYSNSIPADVVREMGADYVIGIDLSTPKVKEGIIAKFLPKYEQKVEDPKEKGYIFSDVVIHPDLREYKSTSFGSAEYMYDIGYECAKEHVEKIKLDLKRIRESKQ